MVSTSLTEARIVCVRSERNRYVDRGWDCRFKQRQLRPHLIDCIDHVGAGLLEDGQEDAWRIPFAQAASLGILRPGHRTADIMDAHRCAVAVRDDDVVPGRRGQDLIVVVDHETLLCTVKGALGRLAVAATICVPYILEAKADRCKLRRVDLDAYGRLLLAVDRDLGNAADLRKLLGQDILGRIIDHGDRQ